MSSLTKIAYYTKKIIRWGIIGIIVITIIRYGYSIGKDIWEQFYPPPPPAPTVAFGKLPRLKFPVKEKIENLEFILETPTGSLPVFLNQAKVYSSPYKKASLLAPEKAEEQAAKLGFIEEPQIISEKIFRWTKKFPLNSELEMDIFSEAFTFTYDWRAERVILTKGSPPDKERAVAETLGFLQKIGLSKNDLTEGKIETFYIKTLGSEFINVASLSEAEFTQVEIFRKNIEEFPVLTADPAKGIVSLTLSAASGDKRIINAEFNYFPVDYSSLSTYPIKSNLEAWKELENGQAFIVNLEESKQIIIRRVYLAYYDSLEPQEFLQPIFVFQGDNNFFAYVSAVNEEWIK